jgi:hypothetical protein
MGMRLLLIMMVEMMKMKKQTNPMRLRQWPPRRFLFEVCPDAEGKALRDERKFLFENRRRRRGGRRRRREGRGREQMLKRRSTAELVNDA